MHDDDHIAIERQLRGLTQQQLADRAQVSVSLLRKVEQGSRPMTHPLVPAAYRAMGVERNELTGRPYHSGDRQLDAGHDLIPEIRREPVAHRPPPEDDREVDNAGDPPGPTCREPSRFSSRPTTLNPCPSKDSSICWPRT